MTPKRTSALVLKRINYGEADRIITLLTKDYGKITLIAKGVRREKSKLAGGIELFSESDISFIEGKGDMGTLISTKLIRHFENIHTDLERMQAVSTILKRVHDVTESDTSEGYYELVCDTLLYMNSHALPSSLVNAWALLRLLLIMGEVVNLEKDSEGHSFEESGLYRFNYESNRFERDQKNGAHSDIIKFLRLLGTKKPSELSGIAGVQELAGDAESLLDSVYRYNRPVSQLP